MPPANLPEQPIKTFSDSSRRYIGHMALNAPRNPLQPVSYNTAMATGSKGLLRNINSLALVIFAGILLISVLGGAAFALFHAKQPASVTPVVRKTSVATTAQTKTPAASQAKPTQQPTTQPTQTVQKPATQAQINAPANNLPTVQNVPPGYTGTLPNSVVVYVSGGNNYYYAGDRQFVTATGVSATLSQAEPAVGQSPGTENHSLIELAVESSDGTQAIEIGWIVDQVLNGDSLPHLFVYHWVNGGTSCYNTCGFMQIGGVAPGSALTINTTGIFAISYFSGAWNLSYNGSPIGYFPESLWSGNFTQIGFIQVFGEVEISPSSTTQCIQMGNGIAGNTSGSATISNLTLTGSSSAAAFSPYATVPSTYSYGSASANGVSIGGPGSC